MHYIAFAASKHDTLASVVQPEGGLVQGERIPRRPRVPSVGQRLRPDRPRHRDHPAADAPVAIYGRGGAAPELIVVTRDASGELRSASWALRPTEDPARAEAEPRALARGAAGAVDVVTALVQWLFLLLGVVRIH